MSIKNFIFILGLVMGIFACSSVEESALESGYKNVVLNSTQKDVSRDIPSLQKAPDHVSAKRGEGFKEYFTTKQASFTIDGVKFNPSIFCVFNAKDELVSFKIYLVVEISKGEFDKRTIMGLLNRSTIKGLTNLSKREGMEDQLGNDIIKKITIDMESTDFPVVEYKVKYLP
ncbi:MAG: hypothetical protein ACI94Y_002896 [Maribacter sp.]|jgi:hypothetical protein